ncbi:Histidine kinase [Burkholderiales bacterium JOSHI_001]|nr:Histidine kinase [Burkholderiales bacterium JOSHI_001]
MAAPPPSEPESSAFASRLTDLGEFGPDAAVASARERTAEGLNLCRPVLALRAVLFVQAALALGTLLAADGPLDWLARMDAMALAALAGSLLWLAMVCAAKRGLARLSAFARAGLTSLLGGVAALLGWALLLPLGLASPGPWRALSALGVGMGLALALWAWIEQRTRAAQPADASARLAELQSRIRPHFLFNALNTAITLVQVDPQRAEGMLEDLAELFRVALAEAGASVSLDEEIDIARRYLAIEQLRFGKRLQLDWDLDPAAAAARVPPLVLQPLVENAVRHGVEPLSGGGRVKVRTQARHGMARILVSNTVGVAPSRPGAGMALANVRERVKLLHDVGGSLETWREGDQFHARLSVPL